MKKNLTPKKLKEFISLVSKNLKGEWVLIGGTVLPLLGVHHRITVDIDLIGKNNKERAQQLELMKLAEKLKIPAETINQAGALFLEKIKGFEKKLEILLESKECKIYRPNLSLFLELKLERLSESDKEDCLEMIKWSVKNESGSVHQEAVKFLKNVIKSKKNHTKSDFMQILLEKLQSAGGSF